MSPINIAVMRARWGELVIIMRKESNAIQITLQLGIESDAIPDLPPRLASCQGSAAQNCLHFA